MIKLHLAIYSGDVETIDFDNLQELCEYINELKQFNCIWLATSDGEDGEIIVTEDITRLIFLVTCNYFIDLNENTIMHLQEYQNYEDAYNVALDMREGNPKCYA